MCELIRTQLRKVKTMATVMFKIELRKLNGGSKQIANVKGVERKLIGYWHIDRPYGVDETAIHDALPIPYRKAYERSSQFWYDEKGNASCYLKDAQNKRLLAILQATPYEFTVQ